MSAEPTPRVLVADDERLLRALACRVLERAGFAAEEAADPDELDRCLAAEPPPDVLVLDAGMPGDEAPALLEKLRRRPPGLAIVLVSGAPLEPDLEALRVRLGASFLKKPFASDALVAAVEDALERAGGPDR